MPQLTLPSDLWKMRCLFRKKRADLWRNMKKRSGIISDFFFRDQELLHV